MHKGIIPHEVRVDASNLHLLDGADFVFICVDDGAARRTIIDRLHAQNIPFVDVGMDVMMEEDMLLGVVRVTTSSSKKRDHINRRIPTGPRSVDDEYRQNIQIADLNALNAVLAVIKFKKIFGVYQDQEDEHHGTYTVNANMLTSLERPDGA